MKKFIEEFKEFALKGNVIDMAVAVAIGAAFNNVVNSLVNDVITPLCSLLTNDVNFEELKIVLKETEEGVIAINYGSFISYIVKFIIIALTIFVVIKIMNRIRSEAEKAKEKEKQLLEDLLVKSKVIKKEQIPVRKNKKNK